MAACAVSVAVNACWPERPVGLKILHRLAFYALPAGLPLHSEPLSALGVADSAGLPVSVETGASGDATWLASLSNGLQVPLILAHITYATMGEALSVLEDHPNLHLELTRLVSPGILEILVKRLGSDRLLYASGAPAWAMAPALEIIRQAEISFEARAAFLGQTPGGCGQAGRKHLNSVIIDITSNRPSCAETGGIELTPR